MNARNQVILMQGSLAVAIASGVFVLLMGGLLLFSQTQGKVAGLTQSTQLVRLQEELRQRPRDEALKQHIRQLDLDLRRKSFTDLRLSHNGALAMIAASALFLASAHLARSQQRKLPSPMAWGPRRPAEEKRTSLRLNTRWRRCSELPRRPPWVSRRYPPTPAAAPADAGGRGALSCLGRIARELAGLPGL